MITKFTIPAFDEQDLQDRLSKVKYPHEYENNANSGWKYGTPSWAVKDMANAWKTQFSWDKKREELNQWQHYQSKVNGLNIHFVHETSQVENAIPLLMLHGWPSTFYEFHKLIKPLRDGENSSQAFHVVVPSLPGYGFSEAPKEEGWGSPKMAETFHKLMTELGYRKYMVFGTDWGASIATFLVKANAESCLGYLTTMPMPTAPTPTLSNLIFHPFKVFLFLLSLVFGFERVYGKKETKGLKTTTFANCEVDEKAGYRAIQATRPYTLAFGLSDSPVGLLGWMLDAYHSWTHYPSTELSSKVALPETISIDEFLTQVTIYWITNTMSSSSRLYYEALNNHKKHYKLLKPYMQPPVAVSYFEGELCKFPRDWIEVASNLVQFKFHDKGGHFAALEVPELLLADLQQFGKTVSKHTPKPHLKKEL
ncbi:hypothetical protein [Parasitella parasitica]|uniref:Epoxide hydrolase N-terminal domain-containing protein n=1 Tax=Parasitella parasitica TaxID=35722 RepID=A0A0B7N3S7_9FUNG|nr:hypothetical protein [Parasitella parasitica]